MRLRAPLALALIAIVACVGPATRPASGPGTAYPCGLHGVSCGHAMCCDEGAVCGGTEPGCPPGSCCYVGGGDDVGGPRRVPARRRP